MKKYIGLYLFLSLIFLAHYAFTGHAVYGDGNNYWAYLHTWRFDGNYDFTNEFRHVFFPDTNNAPVNTLAPEVLKTGITATGKTDNNHTAGTALFFLPWYLLANVLARIFHLVANGYSDIYQITVGLGVIFYLTLAIFITEKLCSSRLAAWAIVLCTPLLYYGSYDVLNSHAVSYLLAVSFWFVFFKADFSRPKWVIVSGLLIGLAALVRLQDIFLLVPLLLFKTRKFLSLSLSLSLIFSPQLFIWQYLYGLPLPQSYLTAGVFYNFIGPLFHPLTGFLSRTPLLLLSLLTLPFIRKKSLFPMFIFFIISWIIISLQGGWTAAAFGGRMFISSLPLFAVLLGFIFSRFSPKLSKSIVLIFFILNIFSIGSFIFLEKEVNSGHKRGLEEHTVRKLHLLLLPFTRSLSL
jgi:hypothetical protein